MWRLPSGGRHCFMQTEVHMAKIVFLPGAKMDLQTALSLDTEAYSPEELEKLLPMLETLYDELEQEEPDDPESEEYYEWAACLEELDDLMDEIQDLMDE